MKPRLLLWALLALPVPVVAASAEPKTGTLIDFRVDIQKTVTNDLMRATVYTETTAATPDEVARKVKATMAEALVIAKSQTGVTVKSGSTNTYPVYAKGGRTIDNWRMRSELLLESRDTGTLSALVGKLQSHLAVGNLQYLPAPETRRKMEDDATQEALEAFRSKAERIAAAMKKTYRIRQMNIGSSGQFAPPRLAYRAAALSAEAAPMPVEAGETTLTIDISGQIELSE